MDVGTFVYEQDGISYTIAFRDYDGVDIVIQYDNKEEEEWNGGYKVVGPSTLLFRLERYHSDVVDGIRYEWTDNSMPSLKGSGDKIEKVEIEIVYGIQTCNFELTFDPWKYGYRTSEELIQFDKEIIPGFPLKLYSWTSSHPTINDWGEEYQENQWCSLL